MDESLEGVSGKYFVDFKVAASSKAFLDDDMAEALGNQHPHGGTDMIATQLLQFSFISVILIMCDEIWYY